MAEVKPDRLPAFRCNKKVVVLFLPWALGSSSQSTSQGLTAFDLSDSDVSPPDGGSSEET